MNLKSLEYFLIAAEELNFTKAAERLFISQQALSGHIKRLEDEYNVELFCRRPSLHLTPAGDSMVFYARQFLNTHARMEADFADLSSNYKGHFSIGLSRLRCQVFFPKIWEEFHRLHPNIDISIADGASQTYAELLQKGDIDLYVGLNIAARPNVTLLPLAKDRLFCCIPYSLIQKHYPGHPEAAADSLRQGVDLLQIAHLPFIMLASGNRLRRNIDAFFLSNQIHPHIIMESNHQDLIYRMSRDGYGVGIISPFLIYQTERLGNPDKGSLITCPILNEMPENLICLAHRNDYPLPRYAEDFITITQKIFADYSSSIAPAENRSIT